MEDLIEPKVASVASVASLRPVYRSSLLTLGQLKQQLHSYKSKVNIEQHLFEVFARLTNSMKELNQTANKIDKNLFLGRCIILFITLAHIYLVYGHIEIVAINVFWIGIKLSSLLVLTNFLNCYLGNFHFAIEERSCCSTTSQPTHLDVAEESSKTDSKTVYPDQNETLEGKETETETETETNVETEVEIDEQEQRDNVDRDVDAVTNSIEPNKIVKKVAPKKKR